MLYLLLPRGVRVQYFGGYPKRYAWSARARGGGGGSSRRMMKQQQQRGGGGGGGSVSVGDGSYADNTTSSSIRTPAYPTSANNNNNMMLMQTPNAYNDNNTNNYSGGNNNRGVGVGGGAGTTAAMMNNNNNNNTIGGGNEDVVVSAAMQQLRDPGVLIVAHGSRGKPKTVRLVLTENAITWRTEMRKKGSSSASKEIKLGKLHQVPLSHIMYVDIGKQTTALRRVENASVSESLCFSLLTKEGSLDLEANSPRERDALVQCFSLVLDEVHAQNWRDIYRGPSSDMPSSFDEGDMGMMGNVG